MGIELGQLFPFFIFAFHYFLLYYLSFNAPEPTQRSACIVLVSQFPVDAHLPPSPKSGTRETQSSHAKRAWSNLSVEHNLDKIPHWPVALLPQLGSPSGLVAGKDSSWSGWTGREIREGVSACVTPTIAGPIWQ